MRPIKTEADIDHSFLHARRAAVIAAWSSLGLFEALSDGAPHRLDELPGDPRALQITARILLHAGLLVRRGERWALSEAGRELEEQGTLSTDRTTDFFGELGQLDTLVRDGGPLSRGDESTDSSKIGAHPKDAKRTHRFMRMLYRRSATSARQTATWIDEAVDAPARILDLGGGHGRYGRELAELGHEVTLFDLPVCIDFARDVHGEAIDYIAGDFFEDDLGGPYDAILASNIVHGLSDDQCAELTQRASQTLADDGILVYKDMFLDEYGAWPADAALFGLVMLMYTDGGSTYSVSEVRRWFEDAGLSFEDPVVYQRHALLVGRRS